MHRHNGGGHEQLQNNKSSTTNIGHNHGASSTLDCLPKQFVVSMKKLFDILDDQRTGFVKFADIQKGWQDDGCKGLPRGVVESLRKVTPANGLLSFERFCAGLKICLLHNQKDTNVNSKSLSLELSKPPRPPPLLDIENPIPNGHWSSQTTHNMATVRPNNNVLAMSLPQLSPNSDMEIDMAYIAPRPPPKPPRSTGAGVCVSTSVGILPTSPTVLESTNQPAANNLSGLDKAEIRHALQNWQMGILMSEMEAKEKRKAFYAMNQITRGTADGGSSSATDSYYLNQNDSAMGYQKKSSGKRREPRRHTLQNGIDYNMLKRLKQFEEEREILLQGITTVEKAREWYIQQISYVQDKIKHLGRMGSHVEQWSEVKQERLDFQRARVLEVNRHLSTLIDTWERGGFPMHFNLAIRPHKMCSQLQNTADSLLIQPTDRLKQQNRQLTNEVNIKTDRIALLEREKRTLIKELLDLQQRIPNENNNRAGLISVVSQSSPVCSSSSGGLGDADVVY